MKGLFLIISINIPILIIGFFILYRQLDKKISPQSFLSKIEKEINDLVIELNQTTERNIGVIEERINTLKQFLEKADKRLSVLKREIEKRDISSKVYSHLKPSNPKNFGQNEHISDEDKQPISYERKRKTQEDAKEREKSKEPINSSERPKGHHDKVLELYHQGIAPNIIANRLKTTVSEVELIISLKNRKIGRN